MRAFRCLLLVLAATGAGTGFGQTTSGSKSDSKEKWVPAGHFEARLSRIDNAQKMIHVVIKEPFRNGRSIGYHDKEIEFATPDDLKVRVLNPPQEFDDKGKPKRPSAKRLKELRGNGKLPGYQAEFDNLKPDQIVDVYLKVRKEKGYGHKTDAGDNKPVLDMIVIAREPVK